MSNPRDLVQGYYDAFNAGDTEAMLRTLADDVVHDINQGGREVGKLAFEAFLQRMNRCYRERLADITIMMSEDCRRAAVEFTVHGTYLATDEGLPPARNQTYVVQGGAFLELESGRIKRVTNYYNLQEWLRQIEGQPVEAAWMVRPLEEAKRCG
jgi:steroid delta-isomerase-like uncharacterized protein